jgi:hypothetical protein
LRAGGGGARKRARVVAADDAADDAADAQEDGACPSRDASRFLALRQLCNRHAFFLSCVPTPRADGMDEVVNDGLGLGKDDEEAEEEEEKEAPVRVLGCARELLVRLCAPRHAGASPTHALLPAAPRARAPLPAAALRPQDWRVGELLLQVCAAR